MMEASESRILPWLARPGSTQAGTLALYSCDLTYEWAGVHMTIRAGIKPECRLVSD